MSSPQYPGGPTGPLPPYGTPSAYGTPPPPGSSVTTELPPSAGEPPYRPMAGPVTGPMTGPAATGVLTPPAPRPATQVPAGPPTATHRSAVAAVRVLGVLLTLGLVVGGTVAVLAEFFVQSEKVTSAVKEPVTKLVAQGRTGDVRLRVGRAGEGVTVVRTLRWTFDKPTVPAHVLAGGVLTLPASGGCGRVVFGHCSVDLDVTVPPGTQLDLQTTSGDIHADARGGTVRAHATTGDVDVTGTGSTAIDARTTTGGVTVRDGAPNAVIGARSTTGDVTVALTAVPSDVSAVATTGDVTVTVPQGTGYRIESRTTVGDETVGPSLRNDSSSNRIVARATTGDVTVSAR